MHGAVDATPSVHCLPATAGGLSARALLSEARAAYGGDAAVRLPDDIVTTLSCSRCGHASDVYRAAGALGSTGTSCPVCRARCRAESSFLLREPDQFGDRTLEDLGLPALSIVAIEHPSGEAWWEVAGDEARVWRFD